MYLNVYSLVRCCEHSADYFCDCNEKQETQLLLESQGVSFLLSSYHDATSTASQHD